MKPVKKLKSVYTNMKDKVDKWDQSSLVYKINCLPPCNGCYIGQTSKKLSTTIKQHRNDYQNIMIENCQNPNIKKQSKDKQLIQVVSNSKTGKMLRIMEKLLWLVMD